jgi:hypothetical protein
MTHHYTYDIIDGVEVPPLIVTDDGRLPNGHRGGIHVEGASVTLDGTLRGSLWLRDGATARITGRHQGSLHLDDGSTCEIVGNQQGSVHVSARSTLTVVRGRSQGSAHIDPGGLLVVEPTGTHQGSVHNDGEYILRGVRGGSYSGPGTYTEAPGSVVKAPTIRDGMMIYEW